MSYSPTTCTVVVAGDGARCGQPVVSTFTSKRDGTIYGECAEHCACPHEPVGHTPAAGPRPGHPIVITAGRHNGEAAVIDRVCERTLVVCLGRNGKVVRILHESAELYD